MLKLEGQGLWNQYLTKFIQFCVLSSVIIFYVLAHNDNNVKQAELPEGKAQIEESRNEKQPTRGSAT